MQIEHLTNEIKSRPQGTLSSDTNTHKGEGKEHCKVITVRSGLEYEESEYPVECQKNSTKQFDEVKEHEEKKNEKY